LLSVTESLPSVERPHGDVAGYLAHMQPRRAGALALGFSLVGVVLVVLLMGVAAGVGPSGLVHGTARDGIFHAPSPSPIVTSAKSGGNPPQPQELPRGQSDLPAAGFIGTVLRTALAVWLLWLLLKGILWLQEELRSRKRREPAPLPVDFDVLDDPEPLVEEMKRDADLQLELLLGGEPRNAIVACWERFEEQAERVGLARKPWETSSEFILRLLDAVLADPDAVSRLAVLYREARFSEHRITEEMRQRALESLERIRDTVRARTAVSR
jgi:hypothetical protein